MDPQTTVFVVDDDPESRIFISTVLEDNGATVHEACDGYEALEKARSVKPDLMTLDLEMPGKDGGQVYEEMRNDPELASIPVFVISGRPDLRGLFYQRRVPPPEGYLDKPVDELALLRNVRRILALSRR